MSILNPSLALTIVANFPSSGLCTLLSRVFLGRLKVSESQITAICRL